MIEETFSKEEKAEDIKRALRLVKEWSLGEISLDAERWVKEIGYLEEERHHEETRDAYIRKAVIYGMMSCRDVQCLETRMAAKNLEIAVEILVETKEVIMSKIRNKAKEIIKEIIKKETVRNGIECGILPYLFHDYDPYMQWHHEGPEIEKYIKYGIPKNEAVGWFLMGVSPDEVVYSYVNGRV